MHGSVLSIALVLLALSCTLVGGVDADEQYPTRPITLVNPFPPGGLADLTGRPLAATLERLLKQPVVVANKSGAAGAVGMQSVAIAKPDGYTILISVPAISLLPEVDAVFGRPSTFTRDQFVGLARLNADPTILVVNADCTFARRSRSLRAGEGRLELLARNGVAHPGERAPVLHLARAPEEGGKREARQ